MHIGVAPTIGLALLLQTGHGTDASKYRQIKTGYARGAYTFAQVDLQYGLLRFLRMACHLETRADHNLEVLNGLINSSQGKAKAFKEKPLVMINIVILFMKLHT